MPPQNPAPTNYDFFLHPEKQPKPVVTRTRSLRQRLLIFIGLGVILIVFLVVIISLLGSSRATETNHLIAVTQDQNELVRVATEANNQATVQTTINLSQSVKLSLSSAQIQLLAYLTSNGHTVSTQQLAATKDVKTDQELTTATSASNFDAVFAQVMQSGLQSYAKDIKTAATGADPKAKQLLSTEYTGAELLLSEATSVVNTLQTQ